MKTVIGFLYVVCLAFRYDFIHTLLTFNLLISWIAGLIVAGFGGAVVFGIFAIGIYYIYRWLRYLTYKGKGIYDESYKIYWNYRKDKLRIKILEHIEKHSD